MLFEHWLDIFEPISENITLIPELKDMDYRLYIVSNFVRESFEIVKKRYTFFELFDGMVISCYVQLVKPEPEIFQYLLREYKLTAAECLFIDNVEKNVRAAQAVGIETVKYTSPQQLRAELERQGIL